MTPQHPATNHQVCNISAHFATKNQVCCNKPLSYPIINKINTKFLRLLRLLRPKMCLMREEKFLTLLV